MSSSARRRRQRQRRHQVHQRAVVLRRTSAGGWGSGLLVASCSELRAKPIRRPQQWEYDDELPRKNKKPYALVVWVAKGENVLPDAGERITLSYEVSAWLFWSRADAKAAAPPGYTCVVAHLAGSDNQFALTDDSILAMRTPAPPEPPEPPSDVVVLDDDAAAELANAALLDDPKRDDVTLGQLIGCASGAVHEHRLRLVAEHKIHTYTFRRRSRFDGTHAHHSRQCWCASGPLTMPQPACAAAR